MISTMAANKTDVEALLVANFSCKICSHILCDPVQCENNKHYFCRACITKRLRNSQTCPQCLDQLTLETLREPSRIVTSVVSQLKKPRCSHVSRGCTENVQVEELLLHEQTCGYAPVVCSNEGCQETVNRRDKESHETEECKFRKITCESCDEEMKYGLYEKHLCTLRTEMDKMKSRLERVATVLKQISGTQANLQKKLEACEQLVEVSKESVPTPSSTTIPQENTTTPKIKGQIFIIGESNFYYTLENSNARSLEVFDWSTMTWTLYEGCLLSPRCSSIAFLEGSKIMIYGGQGSRKMECLSPSETGFSSTLVSSPTQRYRYFNDYNGVKYGNRIITFYRDVVETKLEPPYNSRTLLGESFTRLVCSVVSIGDSIYIIGGQPSTMEHYDVAKNKIERLSPVPYPVTRMACVVYEDNIIIIGGENDRCPLNDVMMFNVTTQKYKRLPSMLEQRAGCAAVIMGDTIVVMGGGRRNRKNCMNHQLRSVEYHVIGQDSWRELPEMNSARAYATALVYE